MGARKYSPTTSPAVDRIGNIWLMARKFTTMGIFYSSHQPFYEFELCFMFYRIGKKKKKKALVWKSGGLGFHLRNGRWNRQGRWTEVVKLSAPLGLFPGPSPWLSYPHWCCHHCFFMVMTRSRLTLLAVVYFHGGWIGSRKPDVKRGDAWSTDYEVQRLN